MKIAIISTYFGQDLGGAGVSTRLFIDDLPQDYHVSVITATQNLNLKYKTYAIPLFKYLPRTVFYLDNKFLYARIATSIKTILRKIKADIVHIQDLELLPSAMMAAQRLNLPTIITVRDHRFVCNMLDCQLRGVVEFHSKEQYKDCFKKTTKMVLGTSILNPLLYRLMQSKPKTLQHYLKRADAVVGNNRFVHHNLQKAGISSSYIYNCTPSWQQIPKEPYSQFTLLTASRLDMYKGVHIVLDAMMGLPDVHLLIAHEGPELENLKAETSRLQLNDRVTFLGKVPHETLHRTINNVNAVIIPSIWPEPLSRLVWEAFTMKTPVIATDTGATAEMVKNNETGLLIPPNDSSALIKAIHQLRASQELQGSMTENAFQLMQGHNEREVGKYIMEYNKLVAKRRNFDEGNSPKSCMIS